MTHIPYKGIAPAITARSRTKCRCPSRPSPWACRTRTAGKLRALASGGLKRSVAIPDVPTIAESGLPGSK